VGQTYEETDGRSPIQVFFAACKSAKFNAASTLSQKPAIGQDEKYRVQTERSEYMCSGPYIVLGICGNTCAAVRTLYWVFVKILDKKQILLNVQHRVILLRLLDA
jgi:hypothetical protein